MKKTGCENGYFPFMYVPQFRYYILKVIHPCNSSWKFTIYNNKIIDIKSLRIFVDTVYTKCEELKDGIVLEKKDKRVRQSPLWCVLVLFLTWSFFWKLFTFVLVKNLYFRK